MIDLNRDFRPVWFDDVVGSEESVALVKSWAETGEVPHAVLFVGPTGVGKTTCARILAKATGVDKTFLREINCAEDRGLDMVREIDSDLTYKPMTGPAKVWILDEVVQLPATTQKAMLSMIEEPPPWAYFFLCKTPDGKLVPALEGRCQVVRFQSVPPLLIRRRLEEVLKSLSGGLAMKTSPKVLDACAELARGSVREGINYLGKALTAGSEAEQLALLGGSEDGDDSDVGRLCQVLLKSDSPQFKWGQVVECLKNIPDPPETVRWRVLAYASKVLDNNYRGATLIRCFQYSFNESGTAGLKLACWDSVQQIRHKVQRT